jgi:hypothetical protein
MHPQLEQIADEFHFATARLHALVRVVPAERWPERRDPARWSVAECVAHLNLTGAAYVSILREAIDRGKAVGGPQLTGRYRRDFMGWLLWKSMPPPVRIKTKTTAPFVPQSTAPVAELEAEFVRLQDAQLALLEEADGLPLGDIKVQSPFNEKVKYNLYSCLTILPPHQHRHLWQAEQIWR